MVYVQYNIKMGRKQLLNNTPTSGNITLDDFDPSSEWVVESQAPSFKNEDLSWLDLDPLPEVLPSGPGESSGAQNSILIEDYEDEDDDEDKDDDEDEDENGQALVFMLSVYSYSLLVVLCLFFGLQGAFRDSLLMYIDSEFQ